MRRYFPPRLGPIPKVGAITESDRHPNCVRFLLRKQTLRVIASASALGPKANIAARVCKAVCGQKEISRSAIDRQLSGIGRVVRARMPCRRNNRTIRPLERWFSYRDILNMQRNTNFCFRLTSRGPRFLRDQPSFAARANTVAGQT